MIFVDTSFWVSLRDRREQYHAQARVIMMETIRQRVPLVATLLILAETHTYFSRSKPLREQILRDFLENPVVRLEDVTSTDRDAAVHLLRKHDDKDYPLADATSFAVMQRLGIRRVLSFDVHFRQFGGFEVLGLPENG